MVFGAVTLPTYPFCVSMEVKSHRILERIFEKKEKFSSLLTLPETSLIKG